MVDAGTVRERVFAAVEEAGLERDAIRFIYLFGSAVDDPDAARDVDVCVSLDLPERQEAAARLQGRLPDRYDLSVFERLPLQVRKEVFEGELVYRRDDAVYDAAFETFREYETFRPLYRTAIGVSP